MALIDDPSLLDRILRTFRIKGKIDPFELSDTAVPVFDIGLLTGLGADPTVVTTLADSQGVRVGTVSSQTYVPTEPIPLNDQDVTNSGPTVNPAAAAVIVDSGGLGTFGLKKVSGVITWSATKIDFQVEWRNGANSATVALWSFLVGDTGGHSLQFGPWLLNFATDERVRIVTASGGTGTADATIVVTANVLPSAAS